MKRLLFCLSAPNVCVRKSKRFRRQDEETYAHFNAEAYEKYGERYAETEHGKRAARRDGKRPVVSHARLRTFANKPQKRERHQNVSGDSPLIDGADHKNNGNAHGQAAFYYVSYHFGLLFVARKDRFGLTFRSF